MTVAQKLKNTIRFAFTTNPPFFIFAVVISTFMLLGGAKVTYSIVTNDNGLVYIDGYEHAVGLCGGDGMEKVIFAEGVWMTDGHGNTVFVNPGHGKDEEVQQLIELTTKTCAKWQ